MGQTDNITIKVPSTNTDFLNDATESWRNLGLEASQKSETKLAQKLKSNLDTKDKRRSNPDKIVKMSRDYKMKKAIRRVKSRPDPFMIKSKYFNRNSKFLLKVIFSFCLFFTSINAEIIFAKTKKISPRSKIYWSLSIEDLESKAKKGDPNAQNTLAIRFFNGDGVSKDFKKALKFWHKAANQDQVHAQYYLGLIYYYGLERTKIDYVKALFWYKKAANRNDHEAQKNIGWMYYNGKGVNKDYLKSFRWYLKSANQGNVIAMLNIASSYFFGTGVERSYREALNWYKRAFKKGSPLAAYHIGAIYQNGYGVKANETEAIRWYMESARMGEIKAQLILGKIFEHKMKKYFEQAKYWFSQAAERGDQQAKMHLGTLLNKCNSK